MTRENAIEYWEQFNAEIDDLYDACSDADRDVLVKQREIVEYTISALRQQDHFRDVTKKVEPQWISVKDRLPEMGEHYQSEDVLVCIDYRPDDPDTTEDTYVSIDHVDFNCFGQGEFSCERDDPRDGEPSPYFVTHWMPLPEPPEEGTV